MAAPHETQGSSLTTTTLLSNLLNVRFLEVSPTVVCRLASHFGNARRKPLVPDGFSTYRWAGDGVDVVACGTRMEAYSGTPP